MNALRHGLSYVGCDLIESKDSIHEDVAYVARHQAISEGLQRVRDERSRMVSELNDISMSTTVDQIRLALKKKCGSVALQRQALFGQETSRSPRRLNDGLQVGKFRREIEQTLRA